MSTTPEELDEPAATRPPVSPQRESVYYLIFALVVYVCLAVISVVAVPRIALMFGQRGDTPGSTASGASELWRVVDLAVEVRQDAQTEKFSYRRGRHWYSLLVPLVLLVGLQLALKDKKTAGRLHYYFTVLMGVGLIGASVWLLFEIFRYSAGKAG